MAWSIIHRDPPLQGDYDYSIYEDLGGTHLLIADVYGVNNANKIAAAPDLLTACDDVIAWIVNGMPSEDADSFLVRLRYITAKARGEEV